MIRCTFVQVKSPAVAGHVTQRLNRALHDGFFRIGNEQMLAHQHLCTQSVALATHSLWIVEGKHLRRGLLIRYTAVRAVKSRAVQLIGLVVAGDNKRALAESERRINRFG